jgi:hypothetical protein
MSSYGNHVRTPARRAMADKLVELAADSDDGFAEQLHRVAGIDCGWPWDESNRQTAERHHEMLSSDLLAIVALLAEQLSEITDDEAE